VSEKNVLQSERFFDNPKKEVWIAMSTFNENRRPETLTVELAPGSTFPPATVFGGGVRLRARVGVTIRALVCGQFGISDDYLDRRVQTVFLNGRAVDDVDRAVVEDGAVLSLSAAMPGLVGATLRKGGHYAALRANISHGQTDACRTGEGEVTVKLFNMVARELGPHFLKSGVQVPGRSLAASLQALSGAIRRIERNGRPAGLPELSDLFESDTEVFFRVVEGR
jgi:hypothetical protein